MNLKKDWKNSARFGFKLHLRFKSLLNPKLPAYSTTRLTAIRRVNPQQSHDLVDSTLLTSHDLADSSLLTITNLQLQFEFREAKLQIWCETVSS